LRFLLRDFFEPRLFQRAVSLLVAIACAAAITGALEPFCNAKGAAPFYVSLRYEVDASAERCWDEAEFRRHVARSVGYDPFRADAPVSVDVRVGGSTDLVDGRVEWHNAAGAGMGERRFRAKDGDCTKLLTEMSFAIGLQIELLRPQPGAERTATPATGGTAPSSSSTSPSPATTAGAQPGTQPTATPDSKKSTASDTPDDAPNDLSASASERRDAGRFRWWVGVGPSLSMGQLPSLTGQGRLFLGVRRSAWSLELGVEGTLGVTEREANGSSFSSRLIGGSATACGQRGVLQGCLIGKLGRLEASGSGVDQPRSPSALVAQAGARVGAAWELSDVWLVTPHFDALLLLTPRTVSLNHAVVWDMPPLSALAGIDLGARFR